MFTTNVATKQSSIIPNTPMTNSLKGTSVKKGEELWKFTENEAVKAANFVNKNILW